MHGKLIRYQHTGQFDFLTSRCYRRLPLLSRESAYACFENALEKVRRSYCLAVGDMRSCRSMCICWSASPLSAP